MVPHPQSGLPSYGYINAYTSRNLTLPGGEIYLKVGKHIGVNRGFGVNHIWTGHGHELPKWGCKTIDDIPAFVAAVITPGAQIMCEFHLTPEGYRLTMVRGRKGCVILSPQRDAVGTNYYSVVTVFRTYTNRSAMTVGTLKAKKAP